MTRLETISSAVPSSGQAPTADDGGDDEEHGDDRRDAGRMSAARDDRVDVGVGGTGDEPAVVGERRVLVEPDADRLQAR